MNNIPNILFNAINFIVNAHDGQRRKSNENTPYACHPIRVAGMANEYRLPVSVILAALFHDVVEDTKYDLTDIWQFLQQNYWAQNTGLILNIIDALTLRDNESKIDAIKRLDIADPYAILIKMLDMIDNYERSSIDKILANKQRADLLEKIFLSKHPISGSADLIYNRFMAIFNRTI